MGRVLSCDTDGHTVRIWCLATSEGYQGLQRMSATEVKATNRQIRRAFGVEAIETINRQGEMMEQIVIPRLMTASKSLDAFDRRIGALEIARADFAKMTCWQRLRWVCGW